LPIAANRKGISKIDAKPGQALMINLLFELRATPLLFLFPLFGATEGVRRLCGKNISHGTFLLKCEGGVGAVAVHYYQYIRQHHSCIGVRIRKSKSSSARFRLDPQCSGCTLGFCIMQFGVGIGMYGDSILGESDKMRAEHRSCVE
jgi:hypothetical protein